MKKIKNRNRNIFLSRDYIKRCSCRANEKRERGYILGLCLKPAKEATYLGFVEKGKTGKSENKTKRTKYIFVT